MSNVAEVPKEPQMVEKKSDIPFGSRESLLRGPPAKIADVVLQGPDGPERHRIRELKQGEVEAISQAAYKQEAEEDGKIVRRFDFEGNKARYLAYALVDQDGRPYFANPAEEWKLLNKVLTPSGMDAGHKAVLKLNGLDEETQKALGKASGTTGPNKG